LIHFGTVDIVAKDMGLDAKLIDINAKCSALSKRRINAGPAIASDRRGRPLIGDQVEPATKPHRIGERGRNSLTPPTKQSSASSDSQAPVSSGTSTKNFLLSIIFPQDFPMATWIHSSVHKYMGGHRRLAVTTNPAESLYYVRIFQK
jgi:hypothetical protein